ncbi:peptidoglycan/LPS O-acetylase OafA/YrhL [Sphingomonas insulae]|uniref:acyltransferase family protein n=1 Tax=Sphingomonas insulae TaxID=424800 RepID=UPI0013D7630C|nr:acyltransferase [Sphingomonas insulae]NIJ31477.1 peptidoglycan/LPS O-acetylase OafA/YrhL [Sphingomonas insulae]
MRYKSLDSLRGLASLVVLFYHTLLVLPGSQEDRRAIFHDGFSYPMAWLYATPLRIFISGPSAVLLFFVLSGFVLSLNLSSPRRPSYIGFVSSRAIRIWLPFAVVIGVSAILSIVVPHSHIKGASEWFLYNWSIGATPANILDHLLMTGRSGDLDNPMWSLVHEIRISLIFPAMLIAAEFAPFVSVVVSVLIMLICATLNKNLPQGGFLLSLSQTGVYIYFFIIGIIFCKNIERAKNYLENLSKSSFAAITVLALILLTISPSTTNNITGYYSVALLILNGIGAVALIGVAITPSKLYDFMVGRLLVYLGKISYSLYLTHVITITCVVYILAPITGLSASLLGSFPVAIVVADICQRCLESPSHRMAKYVTKKMTLDSR